MTRAVGPAAASVFEEVFGLPAHPLMVHAAVVLVPALTLVAVGYALLPAVRERLEPLVIALAVGAPVAAGVARESGNAFRRRLVTNQALPPDLVEQLDHHRELGTMLLVFTLGLAAASIALVLLARSLRTGEPARSSSASRASLMAPLPGRLQATMAAVLSTSIIALGSATAWYAVQTGHSGSSMVWTGM